MSIELSQIIEDFPLLIDSTLKGAADRFDSIQPASHANDKSLVFANAEAFLREVNSGPAAIIITKSKFRDLCTNSDKSFIFSELPDLLVSHILQKYFYDQSPLKSLDACSVEDSSDHQLEMLPKKFYLGKNSQLGAGTRVGENVYIGSNVIIEENVKIGDNTVILDQCLIRSDVQIGSHCCIRSGTSIGVDSFEAKLINTVSKGKVVLGDRVETGSRVCIDKPLEGTTFLMEGVKLDNMVKIAGGAKIGEHSLITAGVQIGSFADVGKFFMIGGNSLVQAGTKICDHVVCGGMSFVDRDIDRPGGYGGNPIQPMRDYLKTLANLSRLPKLIKILSEKDA